MAGIIPYRDLVEVQDEIDAAYSHHHVMAHGKALFESLNQAPFEKQQRLLDSSALKSALAGNPWFEANIPGTMDLDFHFSTPPTQDNINALYAQMHDMVHEAMDRAEASGKQLLILAGEHHYTRNSLLLEHMLLDIAHKAGVNTLINEMDEPKEAITQENLLYWQKQGLTTPPQNNSFLTNDYFWDRSPFDHYVLGDPASTESANWNLTSEQKIYVFREMHMVNALTTEVKGPAIGIFGVNHLQALIEGIKNDPKGNQFEILTLNLSQGITVSNHLAMENNIVKYSRSQFNHENIPHIIVPGEKVDVATAWDMAANAAAHFERQQLGIPEDGRVAQLGTQPEMAMGPAR